LSLSPQVKVQYEFVSVFSTVSDPHLKFNIWFFIGVPGPQNISKLGKSISKIPRFERIVVYLEFPCVLVTLQLWVVCLCTLYWWYGQI